MVNRSELFARPEVKKAVTEICGALRRALPEGSFGEREAHALAISDEAVRWLLQEDLQALAPEAAPEETSDQATVKPSQLEPAQTSTARGNRRGVQ